jgi:hypothetical protein
MSKVFVDLGISLDGLIAGQNSGAKNTLGNGVRLFENINKKNSRLK